MYLILFSQKIVLTNHRLFPSIFGHSHTSNTRTIHSLPAQDLVPGSKIFGSRYRRCKASGFFLSKNRMSSIPIGRNRSLQGGGGCRFTLGKGRARVAKEEENWRLKTTCPPHVQIERVVSVYHGFQIACDTCNSRMWPLRAL